MARSKVVSAFPSCAAYLRKEYEADKRDTPFSDVRRRHNFSR